jgi:hypothetical protein
VSVRALEAHRSLRSAERQRDDQSAVLGELLEPRRREIPGTNCQDDAVIGSVFRVAKRPIPAGDRHRRESRGVEMGTGPVNQVLVDVERRHRAAIAYGVGDQRGVVARAGPDLEHAEAPLKP